MNIPSSLYAGPMIEKRPSPEGHEKTEIRDRASGGIENNQPEDRHLPSSQFCPSPFNERSIEVAPNSSSRLSPSPSRYGAPTSSLIDPLEGANIEDVTSAPVNRQSSFLKSLIEALTTHPNATHFTIDEHQAITPSYSSGAVIDQRDHEITISRFREALRASGFDEIADNDLLYVSAGGGQDRLTPQILGNILGLVASKNLLLVSHHHDLH